MSSLTETSDALKANLQETAVDHVEIAPENLLLCELVQEYRGIHRVIEELLLEINHPYRNWNQLLPRLRAFVLKNSQLYCRSAQGPAAFERFTSLFFQAIAETSRNEQLRGLAVESLLAYVERFLALIRPELPAYQEVLDHFFQTMAELDNQAIMFMVQGHHPMKKMAATLLEAARRDSFDLTATTALFHKVLTLNYTYWLSEEDPLPWFQQECGEMCSNWEAGELFSAISHERLSRHLAALARLRDVSQPETLETLLALPAHMDIVRLYKDIPDKLIAIPAPADKELPDRYTENRKLIFLFKIMNTAGLYLIHEETLREINRSLVTLIHQQSFEEIESFLLTTMQLLKENVRRYPHTALQCIQVLGTEAFRRGSSRLAETFLWETVRFGFQYANVSGVDEDWQPITNPAHLANIRAWLHLIMQEPKWCATLFSALIINISLSGTCVKDTDLFQRDITDLLNHPIEPVYNLMKQFSKLMPVFFNEIGSEGKLREVSTELDEIHKRQDILIHFLRKQSHVESSNLIVDFIQGIMRFWRTLDKAHLKDYLPTEILAQVQTEGVFVDQLHRLTKRIFQITHIKEEKDLLLLDSKRLNSFLNLQIDLSEGERSRFRLLVEMYKLLDQKYNLGFQEIRQQLQEAVNSGFPELQPLLEDLALCDTFQCLNSLLTHLEKLQAIILSTEVFEAREDIFHKRHIAVDIPSVYGRYREKKFDALSLTFRLENMANIYLEKLPGLVERSFITKSTFIRVVKCLRLYLRALKIDGITSRRLDTYVSLLSNSLALARFSYTQYLDIFRGLSEGVKDVMYVYYTNIHQNNLSIIIPQIGPANLLAKYRNMLQDPAEEGAEVNNVHQLSEAFMREIIAATFGLQHLDNFITDIYHTLERQRELLDEEPLDLLMSYNPDKIIHHLGNSSPTAKNLVLLGNKGFNLTLLAHDNKPVPPGFVITTEVFRCWSVIHSFSRARESLLRRIKTSLEQIEAQTGRTYGDPDNPLLVSVRSGASISMPGMMATIHNIGLNEEIAEAMAPAGRKKYLAWDNYRRFLQSWGMTSGVDREIFQALMNKAKERYAVTKKAHFSPDQMRELALTYQQKVRSLGIGIPDDPWLQLIASIEMVLTSWDTAKTKEYRDLMGVSDYWGTAVIVQAMVFGNKDEHAGSGVVFTAHPYRTVRRVALWGDYASGDQGEDIVSGLVTACPISLEQAAIDGRPAEESLENKAPQIYQELLAVARNLVYEKGWNPQEIEFTFEGPRKEDLYILQTRDMITMKKRGRLNVFEGGPAFAGDILGKGIGVSGSALAGRAVFTEENIRELRRQDPRAPLILIRQDTVPEDIREISLADGLLTARGGQTSHASVITLRLEKTCVVGCQSMQVYETQERCVINEHTIRFGEWISIDGRKGLFVKGRHPIREEIHILPM
ncbi:MAG: PEP/pyruvate-binding domain-containing protein [Desulfurivibrionaceae bacterium]|nr:PEP/pyruvate-binding domain-containing protein [Desulfurivibrionaceae bacterium]